MVDAVAITAEQLAALGGTAVLALVVILLLRGDLVTRRGHEAVLARCDDELEKVESDRDRWRVVALDALNVTEAAVSREEP